MREYNNNARTVPLPPSFSLEKDSLFIKESKKKNLRFNIGIRVHKLRVLKKVHVNEKKKETFAAGQTGRVERSLSNLPYSAV
jgi:hypothetical protein